MSGAIRDVASTVVVVTGGLTAAVGILDWLLNATIKRKIKSGAETAWLWLSYQRHGPYLEFIRSTKFQITLVWLAMTMFVLMLMAFAAQLYTGRNLGVSMQLGQLRLFRWQVWIDIGALAAMGGLVTTRIHPRVMAWTARKGTVGSYLGRAWGALGLSFLTAFATVLPFVVPLMIVTDRANTLMLEGKISEATYRQMTISSVGGILPAITIHALSALLLAPVMLQIWLLLIIAALSLYWSTFVLFVSGLFKISQFFLERVAGYDKGPLLAVSALAVAIGAAAKLLTG